MPLLLYKSLKNAEVAVWKATETLEFYQTELASHHFPTERASGIKHPEKLRQWYASRYLLCEIFPGAIQSYLDRKPVLLNGPEVSFSHSGDVVAVMLSSFQTGIDVQQYDAKLEKIAPRFLNPEDAHPFNGFEYLAMLVHIWAIKEAIFKRYVTELPFKDIYIEDLDTIKDVAQVRVERKGETFSHQVAILHIDQMAVAYVLE